MLSMKLIGNTQEELKKAKALYYRAFPKNERRSFPELVENRLGSTEVFCFYDEDTFVGIACLLNSPTISRIIYLAVDESLRGCGYGTKALELLHQSKSEKKFMVDIEIADERAENAEQRKKRKKFYLRAGYFTFDFHLILCSFNILSLSSRSSKSVSCFARMPSS